MNIALEPKIQWEKNYVVPPISWDLPDIYLDSLLSYKVLKDNLYVTHMKIIKL